MKRFLTQCLVDHQSIVKARLRHQGDWHQRIWEAFRPIEGDGGRRGFLYSVEETSQGYKALILSAAVPTRPDWCPVQGWTTKAIPEGFLSHSRYIFSLTANATCIRDSKRISLAKRLNPGDEPECRLLDWLERKSLEGGFRIHRQKTVAVPLDVETFPYSGRQVTLQFVRFQGILDVTEPTLFNTIFNSGIGKAKAFGAGLLLLKPIQ